MNGHRQKILAPMFVSRTHKPPHPVGHRQFMFLDATAIEARRAGRQPRSDAPNSLEKVRA